MEYEEAKKLIKQERKQNRIENRKILRENLKEGLPLAIVTISIGIILAGALLWPLLLAYFKYTINGLDTPMWLVYTEAFYTGGIVITTLFIILIYVIVNAIKKYRDDLRAEVEHKIAVVKHQEDVEKRAVEYLRENGYIEDKYDILNMYCHEYYNIAFFELRDREGKIARFCRIDFDNEKYEINGFVKEE